MMKILIILMLGILCSFLLVSSLGLESRAAVQEGKKPEEVFILAKDSKLGAVKFSHLDHISKNRALDGTQIACVECHHTAQPSVEAVKHPPHKTVWPADRTTTLTAELLNDAAAPPVNICTDCHSKAETKPKLLPEIPQLTLEGSAEPVVLNNQQALHRNCGGCHDAIAKTKETTAPTSKKCLVCHKKNAA